MKQVMLAVGLCAGLLSGCSGIDDGSGSAEPTAVKKDAITGGELVGENIEPYSSAVKMSGPVSCSGVKVGNRRFLTAGHCISLLDPKAATGAQITITNSLSGLGGTTVTVDRFYPHPSYWSQSTNGMANVQNVFDIALVDVQSDTPSIPTAVTDTSAFEPGWLATMVSYGCDRRPDILSTNGGQKQMAEFAGASLAEFQAGYVVPGYLHSATFARYIISDGRPRYPGAPANFFRRICPGDSGGPMFRWNNGWKIAGINSHFFDGQGPLAPTAMFSGVTRVASVSGWLGAAKKIRGERGSITNALTGKCLGVEGSGSPGAPVVLELCADRTSTNNSQYWTKEDMGGGNVRFVNGRSGMCMHALTTSIVQQSCRNSGEQLFRIHVGAPALTPLISANGGYAGVTGNGILYYGPVNVALSGDEGTTRMRWVWTP